MTSASAQMLLYSFKENMSFSNGYPEISPKENREEVTVVGSQPAKEQPNDAVSDASTHHISVDNVHDKSVEYQSRSGKSMDRNGAEVNDLVRKAGVAIAGGSMVGLGIVLIPLPGPGVLIAAAGMSFLGTEFPAAKQVIDDAKDRLSEAFESSNEEKGGESEDSNAVEGAKRAIKQHAERIGHYVLPLLSSRGGNGDNEIDSPLPEQSEQPSSWVVETLDMQHQSLPKS